MRAVRLCNKQHNEWLTNIGMFEFHDADSTSLAAYCVTNSSCQCTASLVCTLRRLHGNDQSPVNTNFCVCSYRNRVHCALKRIWALISSDNWCACFLLLSVLKPPASNTCIRIVNNLPFLCVIYTKGIKWTHNGKNVWVCMVLWGIHQMFLDYFVSSSYRCNFTSILHGVQIEL
jgi:hypothetical protein